MNEQPSELTNEAASVETQPAESIVTVEAPPSGEMLIKASATVDQWSKLTLRPRVDSFTEDELIDDLKALVEKGAERVALDFAQNRFLSVRAIKACMDAAESLTDRGGSLVIVACGERTKRHFEVYGSLDDVFFVRNEKDLKTFKRPRLGLKGPRSRIDS